ncbi:hypothetical protein JB92DRAFT_2827144 [Gautieria morchelliformis]|nr:hypothetical protein JB92DRAFT_2827144 [Gautieria morchelliformis]
MSSLAEVGALCRAIFGNQIAATDIIHMNPGTYENPDGYDVSPSGGETKIITYEILMPERFLNGRVYRARDRGEMSQLLWMGSTTASAPVHAFQNVLYRGVAHRFWGFTFLAMTCRYVDRRRAEA